MVATALTKPKNRTWLGSLLIWMLLLIMVAIFIFFVLLLTEKKEEVHLLTEEGVVKPVIALKAPFHTTPAVLKWASLAAVSAYTFDNARYEEQFQKVSVYFTSNGWDDFMAALDAANTIARIKADRITVSAVVSDPPVVITEGMLSDYYSWLIKVPLLITFQGKSGDQKQEVILSLLVRRMDTVENPQGIGIEQMQVQSQSNA